MRAKTLACGFLLAAIFLVPASPRAAPQKKDYLTATEADKIRDAETPSKRVKLLLSFEIGRAHV